MRPSTWSEQDWIEHPTWVIRDLRRYVPFGLPRAGCHERWLNRARRALLARDGPRCHECGLDGSESVLNWRLDQGWLFPFEVDHVVALLDDGEHALTNMQFLCPECHEAKSAAEKQARPPRLTKAEKMAALEAAGWTCRCAKSTAIRKQWWRHPAESRSYRLDAACRIAGVGPRREQA
jgi:hypothetical protein